MTVAEVVFDRWCEFRRHTTEHPAVLVLGSGAFIALGRPVEYQGMKVVVPDRAHPNMVEVAFKSMRGATGMCVLCNAAPNEGHGARCHVWRNHWDYVTILEDGRVTVSGRVQKAIKKAAPACDECRGTGWYQGLLKRERCSRGCGE